MSKQQKQIIVLAIMGVVLLAALIYNFAPSAKTSAPAPKVSKTSTAQKEPSATKTPKSPTQKPQNENSQSVAEPDASAIKHANVNIDELLASIQEVDFEYDPAEIPRDPLRPLIGTVTGPVDGEAVDSAVPPATQGRVREKVVSGIVWNERAPLAIVDNEIVTPGYVYPDGTGVDSIGPDRVVFKVADSLIQVQLKEH